MFKEFSKIIADHASCSCMRHVKMRIKFRDYKRLSLQ